MDKTPLGEILVENRLITPVQLEEGLRIQQERGGRIGEILLAQRWLQERDLIYALGLQLDIPFAGPSDALLGSTALAPRVIRFGTSLLAETEIDKLVVLIGRETAEVLGADRGILMMLTDDGQHLRGRVAVGRSPLHDAALDVEDVALDVATGIAGRVARTGLGYFTNDAYADSSFYPGLDQRLGYRTQNLACSALRSRNGKVVGVLQALNRRGGAFSDQDIEILQGLAQQASTALETCQAHHDMLQARERLSRENLALRRELKREYRFKSLLGRSKAMQRIVSTLERACDADVPILVLAEDGAGRSHLAKAIHYNSRRAERPLVTVDCAGRPEPAVELDLFGAVAGAGTRTPHIGAVERANGGTVLLRDVAALPLALQARLLRLLVDGSSTPAGGDTRRPVDVRVIAVSDVDLKDEVQRGRVREDLCYRLNVLPLVLPPLRERREDIPVLARHFLDIHAARMHRSIRGFTPDALEALERYHWPGNVAELEAEVERIAALYAGATMVGVEALRPEIRDGTGSSLGSVTVGASLKDTVHEVESRIIREALVRHRGNRTRVARDLGLSRVGLLQKLRRYGLEEV
jgi:Nif-specific regulatory protein